MAPSKSTTRSARDVLRESPVVLDGEVVHGEVLPERHVAANLPKLFLRLRTKSQTSDFPMTLAKWFFENSLVDSKGLEFYHCHWEFLRMLGRNPSSSARFAIGFRLLMSEFFTLTHGG